MAEQEQFIFVTYRAKPMSFASSEQLINPTSTGDQIYFGIMFRFICLLFVSDMHHWSNDFFHFLTIKLVFLFSLKLKASQNLVRFSYSHFAIF